MSSIEHDIGELLRTKDGFSVSGPQTADHVAEVARALGVPLPPSYRSFLQKFGAILDHGSGISGIWSAEPCLPNDGSAFGDTTRCRQQHNLPEHFVVIAPDEEAPHCLDTSRPRPDGECPVICYELHNHHATRVAASFQDFLAEWVQFRVSENGA